MSVIPHPPYFSLFLQLKIILKGCHFHTNEVTDTGSQAMLNTLAEHNYQDAFLKWQKGLEWCIGAELGYLKGDGNQKAHS
jgi:hypothetical protein